MLKHTDSRQLSFEEFRTPFQRGLDKDNRWIRLAHLLPWDELARIYAGSMCVDFGRPGLSPRIVIGALIIKHKLGLSDEETVELIKEHPYLQYFLGYEEFRHQAPFHPSLFVHIRRRLGEAAFNEMSEALLERVRHLEERKGKKKKRTGSRGNSPPSDTGHASAAEENVSKEAAEDKKGKESEEASANEGEHRGRYWTPR